MPSDYGWNADYSSSGGIFPEAVITDFGSVEPLILNDPIINDQALLGDSDHAGGLFVTAFGSSSLGLWNFHPLEDRPGRGGSHCWSDDSSVGVGRCMEGDLSALTAGSSSMGSDADYQPTQQSSNFLGSNPSFGGGAYPSVIPGFEMIQNGFAMTWSSGVIQGTFPPACCDVTLPVVVGSFTLASDFVNPGGSLNLDPPPDPPDSGFGVSIGVTQSATLVPEIPPMAMLLIGFAGLALIGSGRLSRSARLG
jgi:hypothetical protein